MNKDTDPAKRRISTVTTYYMYRYGEILCDEFPGITLIDDFVEKMNMTFDRYDNRIALSLNPDHIKEEGRVSCVSMALLAGWWWILSGHDEQPNYWLRKKGNWYENEGLLSNEPVMHQQRKESHAIIEIPNLKGLNSRFFHGDNPTIGDDYFQMYEVTNADRVRAVCERIVTKKGGFSGIFANEVSRTEAQKRKQGIPDERDHFYGQFIDNYQGLVDHCRDQYGMTLQANV